MTTAVSLRHPSGHLAVFNIVSIGLACGGLCSELDREVGRRVPHPDPFREGGLQERLRIHVARSPSVARNEEPSCTWRPAARFPGGKPSRRGGRRNSSEHGRAAARRAAKTLGRADGVSAWAVFQIPSIPFVPTSRSMRPVRPRSTFESLPLPRRDAKHADAARRSRSFFWGSHRRREGEVERRRRAR